MLKGTLDLITDCAHLSIVARDEELRLRQSSPSITAVQSASSLQSRRKGSLAVVAVGNPLTEEDSAATTLIHLLPNNDICLFSFDSGFSWLNEVFTCHDGVIVLDSVKDTMNALDGFVSIRLTREVLSNSGFAIQATHGLSWLDEIKLHALEADLPNPLFFFGIDGFIFKNAKKNQRSKFLEHALVGLCKTVEICRQPVRTETSDRRGSSHA